MSEMYMTLCDVCADKIDAYRRDEGTYYLTPVPGSRRTCVCPKCDQLVACTQYSAVSKAVQAMRNAVARRKRNNYQPRTDRRAHYRGPWREQEE